MTPSERAAARAKIERLRIEDPEGGWERDALESALDALDERDRMLAELLPMLDDGAGMVMTIDSEYGGSKEEHAEALAEAKTYDDMAAKIRALLTPAPPDPGDITAADIPDDLEIDHTADAKPLGRFVKMGVDEKGFTVTMSCSPAELEQLRALGLLDR